MKEILRILHGKQKGNHNILRDYNLTVYEGEVVYIQGLSGSGLNALLQVLEGKAALDEGNIYIGEKRVEFYSEHFPQTHGIYIITREQDLVGNLTVAENLEVLQRGKKLTSLYDRKSVMEKADGYLKEQGMLFRADALVQDLSVEDCQKLSIIKAKAYGARLIVLDLTKIYFERRFAGELAQIIRSISAQGTAFIILSEQMSVFAEIADRIQLIHHGKDLMEWDHVESDILEKRNGSETVSGDRMLEGFFDYNWGMGRNIWSYLRTVKEKNTVFWEENVGLEEIPEGCYRGKKAVLIPKESAMMLLDNMEIRQNATLTIKDRISRTPFGYIPDHLVDNITEEFYRITGVSYSCKYPSELNYVERKILSVYRWETARPETLLMESPYWGMDLRDSEIFHRYLLHLADKGIRILWFSKSLSELRKHCKKIITTENGCNAMLFVEQG